MHTWVLLLDRLALEHLRFARGDAVAVAILVRLHAVLAHVLAEVGKRRGPV
jgi:hypothetical protein